MQIIKKCCVALLLTSLLLLAGCTENSPLGEVGVTELPAEAQATLSLIRRGGPFPYAKDGSIFFNREHLLPRAPRGYYQEYTVPTPGVKNRGARRIVKGGKGELYYTADHYRSFKKVRQ